ncbi:PlsB protein [Candidatus Pantoea carbekii]|uniref:Glycerol-3-phosphate acyltransferase n=1 Tax=Candidatus Pantoea carbekii TaxID=1235990 RepID=U3U8W5_9GAMM|nr:PlsB protein [Candidatus Pantoea carbekii]
MNRYNEHDQLIINKLVRVTRIYFFRQRLTLLGPYLPTRKEICNRLLQSKAIKKAIEDEARSKKILNQAAKLQAIKIIEEITANFSHQAIRITDYLMGLILKYVYQNINVHGGEYIQKLVQNGHEIIYIPCHRSHMDYLLLSYVLYHQGLCPPHIAAGINLKFWPVGPILCRLGAFFIRRTFKLDKLYSMVFKEYLSELFNQRCPIEYFIEGGRSRTGRLLKPKTGTLSMTLQAMLKNNNRSITFVPIYIGYENVIELNSYIKELRGELKVKEGFMQMINALFKLRNLGQSYVNFGKPLHLLNYLNQEVPEWYNAVNTIECQRPVWMTPIVNKIANCLMIRINKACAVNAINLCATALLASNQRSLSRQKLLEQLECYIQLLCNVPYSSESTISNMSAEAMLIYVIRMNIFTIKKNNISEIIILSNTKSVLMTYYCNNIHHMLAMPSLIAIIIYKHGEISTIELLHQVSLIYPMLKNELFLPWHRSNLPILLNKLCNELMRQGIITIKNNTRLQFIKQRIQTLKLLAATIHQTLQRFFITLSIINFKCIINNAILEKESRILTQRIAVLKGIDVPECFDKAAFTSLISTLRHEGYISASSVINAQGVRTILKILRKLMNNDVFKIIEQTIHCK